MGRGTGVYLQTFNGFSNTTELFDLKETNPPFIQSLLILERETLPNIMKRASLNPINWTATCCSPLSSRSNGPLDDERDEIICAVEVLVARDTQECG